MVPSYYDFLQRVNVDVRNYATVVQAKGVSDVMY